MKVKFMVANIFMVILAFVLSAGCSPQTVTNPTKTHQDLFNKYSGNLVLTAESSGSWEAGQIGETAIFYAEGYFHALYSGYPDDNIRQADTGYACSPDSITWTKSSSNPVASGGDFGAWDEHHLDNNVEEALGLSFTSLSGPVSLCTK